MINIYNSLSKPLKIAIMTLMVFVGVAVAQANVSAQAPGTGAGPAVCGALSEAGEVCTGSRSRVRGIITFALNMLSWIGGIIAVVMIILSGYKFITSGGDPQSITSARRSLIFALVGVIVIVLAQVIIRTVVDKFD